MDSKVREPAVAGLFYDKNEAQLRMAVEACFNNTISNPIPNIAALIVPHAGYVYSGIVAAEAFKTLSPNSEWERIFIIGSSHHAEFEGAAVCCQQFFSTPLGMVETDLEVINHLTKNNTHFKCNTSAHSQEHSIEVQLPFLQYHLNRPFKIVPIILGTQNPNKCNIFAQSLITYFTPGNLFIISTDFSHYPKYTDALTTDNKTADAIVKNSPEALMDVLNYNESLGISNLQTSLCGWTSVLTLLHITKNIAGLTYRKLKYANSGDAKEGNKNRVVGYWAMAVTRNHNIDTLSDSNKADIVSYCRQALFNAVTPSSQHKELKHNNEPFWNAPLGLFVTLYKNKKLRGCIGIFEPHNPLHQTLPEIARKSALNDYRFDPVEANELSHITIEVSLLTPLKKINNYKEIKLGIHGIYMKKGNNSGTFLPQVATQYNWTLEEFLGHCARDKAMLGWHGWQNAEIYTFETIIIKEPCT